MPPSRRDRPPLPAALGRALEPLYRAAVARRNAAFDTGRRVTRLPVPVISVGNLSVGGTGKTPMVMQIVEWLLEAGRRPAIALRGYRAARGAASDEQSEHLRRFPDVPVVARPDRAAGLEPLVTSGLIDCAVLDDAFQHRFVYRDLDLVLIDASRDPFADRCLPAGWLREPVASLRRAGAIVLTHLETTPPPALAALRGRVQSLTGRPPVAESRHAWDRIFIAAREEPIEWLVRRPVIVACAIGNPSAFLAAAAASGAQVIASLVMPDHHRWSSEDAARINRLAAGAPAERPPALLTTEKDWVKLELLPPGAITLTIARPRLRLAFERGAADLRSAVVASLASHPAAQRPR